MLPSHYVPLHTLHAKSKYPSEEKIPCGDRWVEVFVVPMMTMYRILCAEPGRNLTNISGGL